MVGMRRVETTSSAHERSVLATNPAAARRCFNIRHSIRDWGFTLVRGSDSRRLPPASEALAGAGGIGRGLTESLGCIVISRRRYLFGHRRLEPWLLSAST